VSSSVYNKRNLLQQKRAAALKLELAAEHPDGICILALGVNCGLPPRHLAMLDATADAGGIGAEHGGGYAGLTDSVVACAPRDRMRMIADNRQQHI